MHTPSPIEFVRSCKWRGRKPFDCITSTLGRSTSCSGCLGKGGVAAAVLANLNVDLSATKRTIEEIVKVEQATASAGPDLPYTSRAKKVLLAMSEARELDDSFVGTEHLLLGLLREEKGIGAQVLIDAGVSLELAREETLRLPGGEERST